MTVIEKIERLVRFSASDCAMIFRFLSISAAKHANPIVGCVKKKRKTYYFILPISSENHARSREIVVAFTMPA